MAESSALPEAADLLGVAGRIGERLVDRYAELTPRERAVADVMLEHLHELALYSASELAEIAGSSKATVSRLYRRLGYTGADEVREELRAAQSEELRKRRASGTPAALTRSPMEERIAREVAAVTRCLQQAEPALTPVVTWLADAGKVVVVGFRSGRAVAEMLRQGLVQARGDVVLVPGAGHTIGEELADLTRDDAVVLVGLRRRTEGFGALVDAVSAAPAQSMLLGDPTSRRYARQVDHWLECPIDTGGAFDSHAAAAALVSVIADGVLDRLGAVGARRVDAIGALYRRLGELEQS